MGCGASKAEALTTQTSTLLTRYHLNPSHINKIYSLFTKIHSKATRTKTPLELTLTGNRLVIHGREVRAVFAIPQSMLSEHLFDVVEVQKEDEFTFPEFLHLVTVVCLLSRDQLLSFGYHSFAVNEANELSIADFVSGLTDLKHIYPGIVNGADIPIAKLAATAQTTIDSIHAKDSSSPLSLTLSTFTQVMINQPFFIDILTVIQSSIQRKTRSEREWQQHRILLTSKAKPALADLDPLVRVRKAGKKAHSPVLVKAAKVGHSRVHSRALEKIHRQTSLTPELHIGVLKDEMERLAEAEGGEGGLRSPSREGSYMEVGSARGPTKPSALNTGRRVSRTPRVGPSSHEEGGDRGLHSRSRSHAAGLHVRKASSMRPRSPMRSGRASGGVELESGRRSHNRAMSSMVQHQPRFSAQLPSTSSLSMEEASTPSRASSRAAKRSTLELTGSKKASVARVSSDSWSSDGGPPSPTPESSRRSHRMSGGPRGSGGSVRREEAPYTPPCHTPPSQARVRELGTRSEDDGARRSVSITRDPPVESAPSPLNSDAYHRTLLQEPSQPSGYTRPGHSSRQPSSSSVVRGATWASAAGGVDQGGGWARGTGSLPSPLAAATTATTASPSGRALIHRVSYQ